MSESPAPVPEESLGRRLIRTWQLCWSVGSANVSAQTVLTLISGLIPALVTWQTKVLIDGVAEGPATSSAGSAAAVIVGCGLMTALEPRLSEYLRGQLRRTVGRAMTDRLFRSLNRIPGLAPFENPRLLDRIRAAQQASITSVEPVTTGAISGLRDITATVGILVTLAAISPTMAAVIAMSAVPLLLAQLSLSKHYHRMLAAVAGHTRRQMLFASLTSDVRAAKEIRLLNLGSFFRHRMVAELSAANLLQQEQDRRQLKVQSGLGLLSSAIAGGGLLWAVRAAGHGALSVGEVSAFVAGTAGAQAALAGLVTRVSAAHRGLLVLGYYFDVIAFPTEHEAPKATRDVTPLRDRLEFRDVWFRYSEEHDWVLRGVSFTLGADQSVGLVGLNGAGKSTLVKLICRLYEVSHGAILWDGVDIREFPVEDLRARLGVLFQDFMPYDLPAHENIAVGDLGRSERVDVRRAASTADIDSTLSALPRGYDTMLSRTFFSDSPEDCGDSGVTLSGGQWQRVGVARAVIATDRDLLILDEPSSGLDAEAEAHIHGRLQEQRTGRASLLISHRLSALRDVDWIVVLHGGRVEEQGPHSSLMRSNGRYARLFQLQGRGYQLASGDQA